VLHDDFSRKYFPISVYLDTLKAKNHIAVIDIYLFTDDANAIDEALEFHPQYNWMYLEKKRHRGSEGGWENQVPGDSPLEEVVIMLAEFRLAQDCDILVHTASSYSDVLYDSMVTTGRPIERLRPDEKSHDVHHSNNTESEKELETLLAKKREE
jgi:hypothetical protein